LEGVAERRFQKTIRQVVPVAFWEEKVLATLARDIKKSAAKNTALWGGRGKRPECWRPPHTLKKRGKVNLGSAFGRFENLTEKRA